MIRTRIAPSPTGEDIHIGNLYMSPELALVIANIFVFIVSFKAKLILKLQEKKTVAHETFHFSFQSNHPIKFESGQYLEWTVPHVKADTRGLRRYFTIASAPGDPTLDFATKIKNDSSSYKKALSDMKVGEEVYASQLQGDFVLPKDKSRKLVWIAGGIGITPFISMAKYLDNKKEKRDILLFYSCVGGQDFAYRDLIESVKNNIGLKPIYLVGREEDRNMSDYVGFLSAEIIKKEVPDYSSRTYYLSGPSVMVDNYKKLLLSMGISRTKIITDSFPGY